MNTIPPSIQQKRGHKLHLNPAHPVYKMKEYIQHWFRGYEVFDTLSEVVTVKDNFDDLLFPADHPARSMNDTYYLDKEHVLRTHTSAHQNELLRLGQKQFLVTGDVYRKDTIDRRHYPVFHQMEGVKVLREGIDALSDLKHTLSGLMEYLFPGQEYRYLDDYFPFTNPSIQIEVKQDHGWMEVLGAGVIQPAILSNCGISGTGWAFGMGIDRLLLNWCRIPDIRYLWTKDERFLGQFSRGLVQFQEYSKYPATERDISFWIRNYKQNGDGDWDHYNTFCGIAREIGQDLIEDISLLDTYPKGDLVSVNYRITYRSCERTLLNEETNALQSQLRTRVSEELGVELR